MLNKDEWLGSMLFSEQGEELGLLQDVYFMEKMGTIVAYETTDGFFSESKHHDIRTAACVWRGCHHCFSIKTVRCPFWK